MKRLRGVIDKDEKASKLNGILSQLLAEMEYFMKDLDFSPNKKVLSPLCPNLFLQKYYFKMK